MGLYCVTRLYDKYKSMDPEVRRYRKNWFVIYTMQSLLGIAYFIIIPSLHQFVTSSSNPEDPNVQPGLGLSESWYSWIISMSSLGEFTGAVACGILLRWFCTKHLMLVNLCIIGVGGIIYGIGKFGWMLLIGRFCVGIYQGGQMTILRAYLGETSVTVTATLPPEKQKKSKIKYTNFFITFTVGALSVAVGPVLPAIAAQVPNLDQFRWPGYYLTIHSCVLLVLMLVVFREKWTDLKRGGGSTCTVPRKLPLPIYTIACLVFAFFSINWVFSVLDTLENPILGDNFGLTIKYTSYIFAATVVFFTVSTAVIYILQRCGVDNRVTAMVCFTLCVAGTVIAADWQSIGGDPCDQFSADNFVATSNCPAAVPYKQQATDHNPLYIKPAELVSFTIFGVNTSAYTASSLCRNESLQNEITSLVVVSRCTYCNFTSFFDSLSTGIIDTLQEETYDIACQMDLSNNSFYCHWEEEAKCFSLALNSVDSQLTDTENCVFGNDTGKSENITLLLFNVTTDNVKCLRSLCSRDTWSNASSYCDENVGDYQCLASDYDIDLSPCDSNTSASCICEAFSGSPYHCFWNPNSRLTGEHCPRCEPLCRSADHSINFAQFIVGVSLITFAYPMGRLCITLIASDALGTASQGLLMGLMVASGSAARFTGPIWGNAAYLAAGRRTYFPMSVLAGLWTILLVLFVLLYRSMKPKKPSTPPSVASTNDSEEDEMELEEKAEDQQSLLKHMETNEDDPVTTVYLNHQSSSDIASLLEESSAV